jgi:hypothetical protein
MRKRINLTEPQQRYLDRIRGNPGIVLNGRASKVLAVLKQLDLIEYEYELVSTGSGHWVSTYTCRPRPYPDDNWLNEGWPGEQVDTFKDLGLDRDEAPELDKEWFAKARLVKPGEKL